MFNKILVPLDGSELAAKILPQVEDLARTHQSEVVLISVGHFATGAEIGEASPDIIEEAAVREKEASERYLEKTAASLREKGLKVDWIYREGIPAHSIVAYAEEQEMDLIAMATHGRGEIAWVLGSVAEKVVSHATVPILLLRVIEFKPPVRKEE